MAIGHLHMEAYSTSRNQSAIAKAAYNARAKISREDEPDADYRARDSELVFSEIIDANGQQIDRSDYWKRVEKEEKGKRKGGPERGVILARGMDIALPRELTEEQQIELAQEFRQKIMDRWKLEAVDMAIHNPREKRRAQGKNPEHPHIHFLFRDRNRYGDKIKTAEEIGKTKKGKIQYRQAFYKNPEEMKAIRRIWQTTCNRALKESGSDARISMETIARQKQILRRHMIRTAAKVKNLDRILDEEVQLLEEQEELEAKIDAIRNARASRQVAKGAGEQDRHAGEAERGIDGKPKTDNKIAGGNKKDTNRNHQHAGRSEAKSSPGGANGESGELRELETHLQELVRDITTRLELLREIRTLQEMDNVADYYRAEEERVQEQNRETARQDRAAPGRV